MEFNSFSTLIYKLIRVGQLSRKFLFERDEGMILFATFLTQIAKIDRRCLPKNYIFQIFHVIKSQAKDCM